MDPTSIGFCFPRSATGSLDEIAGHARFSTTEKYVQPFDRTRDLSAERISCLTAEALDGQAAGHRLTW